MKVRLKRDIIIPAGTIFDDAPRRIDMAPGHVQHIIGLTDDSSGSLIYYFDPRDPCLGEWFESIDGARGKRIDAVGVENNAIRSSHYDAKSGE